MGKECHQFKDILRLVAGQENFTHLTHERNLIEDFLSLTTTLNIDFRLPIMTWSRKKLFSTVNNLKNVIHYAKENTKSFFHVLYRNWYYNIALACEEAIKIYVAKRAE